MLETRESRREKLGPLMTSSLFYVLLLTTSTTLTTLITLITFYHLLVSIKDLISISFNRKEPKKTLLSSQDSFYHSFTFQSHPEALHLFSFTTPCLYFFFLKKKNTQKNEEEEEEKKKKKPTWVLESKGAA